jgi:Fe-S-cluster-containing dehydrogenase component
LTRADDKNPPLCVTTCPEGAIQYVEIEPDEKQDIYEINKNLVAKVKKWILEPVK